MTYETDNLTAQMNAQLGALTDAAKYKAAAAAHIEYLAKRLAEPAMPTADSYRGNNSTGLLATDYALDDYTTWK